MGAPIEIVLDIRPNIMQSMAAIMREDDNNRII